MCRRTPFYPFIEKLFHNGITGGCAGCGFCPGNNVTRAQMAVFLMKSPWGAAFVPPPATGTAFGDVDASNPFAPWIEELAREGFTGSCGNGNYSPNNPVTRAQMAVFLLTPPCGSAYVPPPGGGHLRRRDAVPRSVLRLHRGPLQPADHRRMPGQPAALLPDRLRAPATDGGCSCVKTFLLQLYGN